VYQLYPFSAEDVPALLQLFYETIHHVNAKDYTPDQINAWAPKTVYERAPLWLESLQAHKTVVAKTTDGQIAGFGDMTPEGYFDRLYVHKDHQRCGVATMIADFLEKYATSCGHTEIEVHASITARPFFESRGYIVTKAQQVERLGITIPNFIMKKPYNAKTVV